MDKKNIQIVKTSELEWDKIKSHGHFETSQNISENKKIVFALGNYLYGYFDCHKMNNKHYQIRTVDSQFKIYCYNLSEELKEDEEKVKALFFSRTRKEQILKLKVIAKKNHFDYLWCPGTEEIISQARVKINDKLIEHLTTSLDFQNKKQMFLWYQSLIPNALAIKIKTFQLLIVHIESSDEIFLPHFPLPMLFDGKNYLGTKIKFLFSFDFVEKKTDVLNFNPESISLMTNLHLSHKDMVEETKKIHKYLKFAGLGNKIRNIQSEFKIADFLFECQQVEYLHYSGHAEKKGLVFVDGVMEPHSWLTLDKLPEVMVFSCCEFLKNDLALRLIKKGVSMILVFEGVVDSPKACAFIKDLYWQWSNAGISFLDALHVTFKKYLHREKLTFYPKLYGEGRRYLQR